MNDATGHRLGRRMALLSVLAAAAALLHHQVSESVAADVASDTKEQESSAILDAAPLPSQGGSRETRQPKPMDAIDIRGILDLYGVDASQLEGLRDGVPLGNEDEETLVKILYRLPQLPALALHRERPSEASWSELIDDPSAHRVQVYRMSGRVRRVEETRLVAEAAERFEFDHYYRVTLELDDAPNPVLVCTRTIPDAWPIGAPFDERGGATGLFLKTGDTLGRHPELVFAAARVAWYPDRVDPARQITKDRVYLADLGFDVGLFDDLKVRNRKPLGVGDRECFYQLMSAVDRARSDEFQQKATRSLELPVVLQDPAAHQGELMTIRGMVRRVTKIVVDEADVNERFAIDAYYQIDVLVSLGDQIVRLGEQRPGEEGPVFRNNFPITVCVRRLPPELSVGDGLRENIRIAACYFKLWAFRTDYVSSFDEGQLQVGPMFIGLTPEVERYETTLDPRIGYAVGLCFLMVLAGLWYGVWRWNRSDRRFRETLARRRFEKQTPSFRSRAGSGDADSPNSGTSAD